MNSRWTCGYQILLGGMRRLAQRGLTRCLVNELNTRNKRMAQNEPCHPSYLKFMLWVMQHREMKQAAGILKLIKEQARFGCRCVKLRENKALFIRGLLLNGDIRMLTAAVRP